MIVILGGAYTDVDKNLIETNKVGFNANITSKSKPIEDIAEGANPKPITIIIGPTIIGGNSLLIQALPKILINIATNAYTNPTAIIAVNTAGLPLLANPTITGVIKANELPK